MKDSWSATRPAVKPLQLFSEGNNRYAQPMTCPECGSLDTYRPSFRDHWEVGVERCRRCGHQDDWLRFCPNVDKRIVDKGVAIGDELRRVQPSLEAEASAACVARALTAAARR
jgi:hypothetical protein